MSKVLTLGAGNMASALLYGMKAKISSFYAFTPSQTKAKELCEKMGGQLVADLNETPQDLDFVFLAFKPQQFKMASQDFLEKARWKQREEKPIVVSMLAGTPLAVLEEAFGNDRIVRIMPNTPSLVGKAMILVLYGKGVSESEKKTLNEMFAGAGKFHVCESEEQFDAATAVTGSGPAYIFEFSRQMALYLEQKGLDKKDAATLVKQLFLGSSLLMEEATEDFEELRNKVTSKKGVTYEALETFKRANWEELTLSALENNFKRSLELREEALKLD